MLTRRAPNQSKCWAHHSTGTSGSVSLYEELRRGQSDDWCGGELNGLVRPVRTSVDDATGEVHHAEPTFSVDSWTSFGMNPRSTDLLPKVE